MFDLDTAVDQRLHDLLDRPGAVRPVIVFPEASDPRIVAAASALISLARVVLIGDAAQIRSLCDYNTVELACDRDRFFNKINIVSPDDSPLKPTLAKALSRASQGRKWAMDENQALETLSHPVYFSAMLVRQGYADACLGGAAYATKDFLGPCLRLIKPRSTAFEMGIFALPDTDFPIFEQNIVMFADVALNLAPSPEQLADIAVESCKTLRDIVPEETLPEINGALVSYSTKGSGQGPSVEAVRAADALIRKKLSGLQAQDPAYRGIHITSELQISVALSRDAARVKLKDRLEEFKSAGRANVIIVPGLDEGNMLFHLFNTQYPGAQSSLVMGGMDGRVLDYSRGSSVRQIIRGARLLMLTRIKSHQPLVQDSPLFAGPRVLTLVPGPDAVRVTLFKGDRVLLDTKVVNTGNGNALSKEILATLNRHQDKDQARHPVRPEMVLAPGPALKDAVPGAYRVTPAMIRAMARIRIPDHPVNLGVPLALAVAREIQVPAYAADCPTIDRPAPAESQGPSPAWHALSQRHAARIYADTLNKSYPDLDLIVAHLGDDISTGAHINGKCVLAASDMDRTAAGRDTSREHLAHRAAAMVLCLLHRFAPRLPHAILFTGPRCGDNGLTGQIREKLSALAIQVRVIPGALEPFALREKARDLSLERTPCLIWET